MSTEPGGTLPRGRHGIDREAIRAHQLERIVDATIETVAEQGYAPTTVANIVSRARVSRETFYALFRDKEECYQASLMATIGSIETAFSQAAAAREGAPHEKLEAGLHAYFTALAERPTVATCFVLEAPRGHRRLGEADRASPQVVDMVSGLIGRSDDRPAIVAYLLMMGAVVRHEVEAGRTAQLPDRLPELMPVIRRMLQI